MSKFKESFEIGQRRAALLRDPAYWTIERIHKQRIFFCSGCGSPSSVELCRFIVNDPTTEGKFCRECFEAYVPEEARRNATSEGILVIDTCPECGFSGELRANSYGNFFVQCTECDWTGAEATKKKDAVIHWNDMSKAKHTPAKSHTEDELRDNCRAFQTKLDAQKKKKIELGPELIGRTVELLEPHGYAQSFMSEKFLIKAIEGFQIFLVCYDGREQTVFKEDFQKDFALLDEDELNAELDAELAEKEKTDALVAKGNKPRGIEDIVTVKIVTDKPIPKYNPSAVELRLDGHKVDGLESFCPSVESVKKSVGEALDNAMKDGVIDNAVIKKVTRDPMTRTLDFEFDANVPVHVPGDGPDQRDLKFKEGELQMFEGIPALKEIIEDLIRKRVLDRIPTERYEETHSFEMKFPNGDLVTVPAPVGDDWKEEVIFDEWTKQNVDDWGVLVDDTHVRRNGEVPRCVEVELNQYIDEDHEVGDFTVEHEAGVRMLVEYARRMDDVGPKVLSLSKWTRRVADEKKDDERPFPLLSETK